jgi:hypothetical protein
VSAPERLRRAAVARRVLASAPQAAASLDWDALGHAPHWLALPDDEFAMFQCRVGAVLCGRELRLWIDRGRLDAAQAALGASFLRALLAESDSASSPPGLAGDWQIESPAQVHTVLREAGASVLLATLRSGALRDAVGALLAPAIASSMAAALARALVAHAESLEAQPQAVQGAAA